VESLADDASVGVVVEVDVLAVDELGHRSRQWNPLDGVREVGRMVDRSRGHVEGADGSDADGPERLWFDAGVRTGGPEGVEHRLGDGDPRRPLWRRSMIAAADGLDVGGTEVDAAVGRHSYSGDGRPGT
jgi:hypothetical protein